MKREGRQFSLTSAGEYFYRHGKGFIDELEAFKEEVIRRGEEQELNLSIGYPKNFNALELHQAIVEFTDMYPEVNISITSGTHEQLFEYLLDQQIDFKISEQRRAFNEDYYNSHEGMELTLKTTISGYRCMYCSDAVAYHCSGIARKKTSFDISRQRAYFYQYWGKYIKNDLEIYLSQQMNIDIEDERYIIYNMSSSTDWKRILKILNIKYISEIMLQERFDSTINLYDCISFTSLHHPAPYLFLCDSFVQIAKNYNWIRNRNNPNDIVMDLNGNILKVISLIGE